VIAKMTAVFDCYWPLRLITQAKQGTNVVLFARLKADHRAFGCLVQSHLTSRTAENAPSRSP